MLMKKKCAFCGQTLDDRTLVDSYSEFFSDTYKALSADVRKKCEMLWDYKKGGFRTRAKEILQQNEALYVYWKEIGQTEPPKMDGLDKTIMDMESAALLLEDVFVKKQGNLTEAAVGTEVEAAITAWNNGRKKILSLNKVLSDYVEQIKKLKALVDATELPQLEKELKTLQAVKRRHEKDTISVIKDLQRHEAIKMRIAEEKTKEKDELNNHGYKITKTLGKTINFYLARLNAGFRIDYREPNYQGKEPAASYQILINEVPVSPRSTSGNLAEPSFRNTLSAGDKSTLALAFFLAKINADTALAETIVVPG